MTTPPPDPLPMRWRDYVLLRSADLSAFWAAHLGAASRKLLYVMGRGFDPRARLGLANVLAAGGEGARDVIALEFPGSGHPSSADHGDLVSGNWEAIQALVQGKGSLRTHQIPFRSGGGHRSGYRNAAAVFDSEDKLADYTDVVVDVSAMPRAVYFPLIARILHWLDEASKASRPSANLFALVAEDPALDARIKEEGIDEAAGFMHSFEGKFKLESIGQDPKVWIPLLGEGKTTQFDRIYDRVKPDEVCPVVPSPSLSPRRGDDIVMEYRDLLFDQIRIDPRNIIYASEQNPFEVYRRVRQAALQYHQVLHLLGGCKIALSALSSKLMSLGALLVAYEMKPVLDIGVAHIECHGYSLQSSDTNAELVGMWLAGECYETEVHGR